MKLQNKQYAYAVAEIIRHADPVGLIGGGAPNDGYDSEVNAILEAIKHENDKNKIAKIIYEIFCKQFDSDLAGPKENYGKIAKEILKLRNNKENEWIREIDFIFHECDDDDRVYNGECIEMNVRTYHLEKYPFEGEYNLEVSDSTGKHVGVLKIDDLSHIKKEVDGNIEVLKKSRYKVKISIDGKHYKNIKGEDYQSPKIA